MAADRQLQYKLKTKRRWLAIELILDNVNIKVMGVAVDYHLISLCPFLDIMVTTYERGLR
eukprot:scaffold13239_cov123-Skeletonema_dohrnii-CCMP3373.AAC.4